MSCLYRDLVHDLPSAMTSLVPLLMISGKARACHAVYDYLMPTSLHGHHVAQILMQGRDEDLADRIGLSMPRGRGRRRGQGRGRGKGSR